MPFNACRHGRVEDESHFHVLVVAAAFEGRGPLERHRAIQGLFTDDGGQVILDWVAAPPPCLQLLACVHRLDTATPSLRAHWSVACQLKFHALRITAKTPAQWARAQSVPDAPKCAGGDGRGPTDVSLF